MNLHAQPPLLPPGIYQAVARNAETHPEAKLVLIYDPEQLATVCGIAQDGQIIFWSVRMPTTEEMARELLLSEMRRGNVKEDEMIFLNMRERPTLEVVN